MPPVTLPSKCDLETDVLVIGAGSAGMPAAFTIAKAGYKALLVEDRPKTGGSLAMVVGAFAVCGSDEQKAAGIQDSPDIFFNDLVKFCDSDRALARAYVDHVHEIYEILKEEGMVWPGLANVPGHTVTRCLGWLLGYGPKIVECFEKRCKKLGVPILFKHRAQRLTIDPPTGRVTGAVVFEGDKKKYIKANMGVVIATGGFLHNKEIIGEYDPYMVNCIPKMPISHQGDGLKMGLELGAATTDIGIAVAGSWPLCKDSHSRCIWALDVGGIMVNKFGKRFHSEGSDEGFYGIMTRAAMAQPDGFYCVVYTKELEKFLGVNLVKGEIVQNMEHVKDLEQCVRYYGDTPEELAQKLGVDPVGFAETIAKWNSDVEKVGYDTVFNRKAKFCGYGKLDLLKPPFIGIKAVTSLTSGKGGLKINDKMQVIDQFGDPIPGLFAGGEVAGGLFHKSYALATMSSMAPTQGMLAARTILEEFKGKK